MKKNVIRLLMSFVALFSVSFMQAENKLWIEDLGDNVMAVQMTNDDSAAALQFTLVIPEGMYVVPTDVNGKNEYVYRNPERFSNDQIFQCQQLDQYHRVFKCAVVSLSREPFIGNEGAVAKFKVGYTLGEGSQEDNIKLQDIIMATADGTKLDCNSTWDEPVTIGAAINVYFPVENLLVNPGEKVMGGRLPVALKNSRHIKGIQMDVTLPTGFKMENIFEHTDRLTTGTKVSMTENAASNTYRLVLVDIMNSGDICNKGDGDIFYLDITAPKSFGNNETIKVENVIASVQRSGGDDSSINGEGFPVNIVNGNVALENANAVIAGLKTDFENALAKIAQDCPNVKDNFKGEEISAAIAALEEAVKNAYENMTLTSDYKEVIETPAAAIKADIERLVADANVAEAAEVKRQNDNKAVYDAVVAALDVVKGQYNDNVTIIRTDYADYVDEAAITAVGEQITAAYTAALNAFNAVAEAGVFESPVDVDALEAAVAKLLSDAQARKAAADSEDARKAENLKNYNAVIDQIKGLQTKLDDEKAGVESNLPNFMPTAAVENAQNLISAETQDAEAAYAAVSESGVFEFTVDAAAIDAAINAVRPAANKAAYDADKAAIDQLFENYRSTIAEIQANYKDFEDVGAENAVKTEIEVAERAIDKSYADVSDAGYYVTPLDTAALQAAIDKLLTDAKQAKEDKEAADEDARKAANLAAYNAAMAQIAEIQKHFDETVAAIAADYAEYVNEEAQNAVQAQITAAKDAVEAEKVKVENEGIFNYIVDAAALNAAIDKLLADAKQAKEDKETADEDARKAANKAAYDVDMGKIVELNTLYINVLAEIAENYADFRNAGAENAVKLKLEAAEKAVKRAYQAVADAGVYATPAEFNYDELNAAIDKLLADAKQAKEDKEAADEDARKAANLAAYNAAMAQIAEIQKHFDETVAAIVADYAEYVNEEAQNAVQAQITAAKDAVEAEKVKVENEGIFNYTVDAAAFNAAIDKLLADAKQAKEDKEAADEDARKAANLAAYNAAMAQIAEIQEHFDETVAAIAADYAEYVNEEAQNAVQAQITVAKDAVEAEKVKVENEGIFNYIVDAAALNAAIDKLLADAKQAKEDKETADAAAEAQRQAENNAAYKAVLDELKAVQDYFNATVAEIKDKYTEFEDVDAENAVRVQIDDAKNGADAAYAAVKNEGKFNYVVPVASLNAAIEKLLTDAKAAADAKAETDRVAANKEAYDAVLAEIAEVEAELEAAIAKIEAEYPGYTDYNAEVRNIDKSIANAKTEAYAAFVAVTNEGEYDYAFDADAVLASIQAMLDQAAAWWEVNDVEGIEADDAEVIYFTTDGKRHANPVHGEINIVVRKNGQTSKIYVK